MVGKFNNKTDRKRIRKDARAMKKYGMKGSLKDMQTGQGTKYYNDLRKAKGQDYVDSVAALTQNNLNKELRRSGALFVASFASIAYLTLK